MRRLVVVVGTLLAASLAAPASSQSPTQATTEDGRKVLLYPDGTWKYAGAETRPTGVPRMRSRSPLATAKVDLLRGKAALHYNPKKWKQTTSDEGNKTTFQHASGEAYAMVIAERIQIPLPKLKEIALQNAKQAAPNARIVGEESVRVNGVDVLAMQMEGTIQGIDFTYYGYYYSGAAGSIQVLTYTGRNLFQEFRSDFEDFLNGFQVAGS